MNSSAATSTLSMRSAEALSFSEISTALATTVSISGAVSPKDRAKRSASASTASMRSESMAPAMRPISSSAVSTPSRLSASVCEKARAFSTVADTAAGSTAPTRVSTRSIAPSRRVEVSERFCVSVSALAMTRPTASRLAESVCEKPSTFPSVDCNTAGSMAAAIWRASDRVASRSARVSTSV